MGKSVWEIFNEECPEVAEVGAALVAACNGDGRPAMLDWMEARDIPKPGSNRAYRLHRFGRDLLEWLEEHGVVLAYADGFGDGGWSDD